MPPPQFAHNSRRQVRFPPKSSANDRRYRNAKVHNMSATASNDSGSIDSAEGTPEDAEIIRDISTAPVTTIPATPLVFTKPPPIRDEFETETSEARIETMHKCMPFLQNGNTSKSTELKQNSFGLPILRQEDHARFLRNHLKSFQAQFVALDASRPWLFYWSLAGLSFLGQDISEYRERYVSICQIGNYSLDKIRGLSLINIHDGAN